MKLEITKKIGKREYKFTVEGSNLHEVVMESKNLSFPDIDKCGNCGSDNLFLDAHVAQNKFKYTTVKCSKCKATLNFGQQQENPEVYYLRTTEKNGNKVYDWKTFEQENSSNQAPIPPANQNINQGYPQQNYPPQGYNQYGSQNNVGQPPYNPNSNSF